MGKIKHTVMQSATSFSDTRAEILKEIRERSICGKRQPVFMEPSGYFGCAIPHRYMDIF